MDLNLNLYKIFYTTAITQNISLSSKQLFISQPAISKAIKKLESNLNTTLFIRSSKGVRLTDDGKVLFEHIKSAFEAINIGEEKLKQRNALGIGHLSIGVSTTLCKYILLPYLKDFIKYHPNIRFSIYCQSSKQTLELLEKNKIDIGLVGLPYHLKQIKYHSIGKIQDTFVATKEYLQNLNLIDQTSKSELFEKGTLMLLDKENITRQYIDDYLSENHLTCSNILETSTMDLLIDFAKISLGVSCVIKEFVKKELENGELTEIPLDIVLDQREIGFAYMKNIPPSHALQDFINYFTYLNSPLSIN